MNLDMLRPASYLSSLRSGLRIGFAASGLRGCLQDVTVFSESLGCLGMVCIDRPLPLLHEAESQATI